MRFQYERTRANCSASSLAQVPRISNSHSQCYAHSQTGNVLPTEAALLYPRWVAAVLSFVLCCLSPLNHLPGGREPYPPERCRLVRVKVKVKAPASELAIEAQEQVRGSRNRIHPMEKEEAGADAGGTGAPGDTNSKGDGNGEEKVIEKIRGEGALALRSSSRTPRTSHTSGSSRIPHHQFS